MPDVVIEPPVELPNQQPTRRFAVQSDGETHVVLLADPALDLSKATITEVFVENYAIVRDGVVENVAAWDGATKWQPPEGTTAIKANGEVASGWTYDDKAGGFTAPEPAPEPVGDAGAGDAGAEPTP